VYEAYFGLDRSPFNITPDTSLFFDGGHRGDILGALVYAVHRGEGIIKVVGEVGSGKTMLCRMLQLELPENVEIVYIANPSVSPEDILFVIASELHFEVERDATKHELVSMLQNYLLKKHEENRQVVLFVEEAQGMPLETLEEIRLLSNLETDRHKLLQIILFGQPELDENLAQKSIRQLRERITHDFNLAPLSAQEIHRYLNFRMREVGYTGPELINLKLAQQMEKHSLGLLRRINILADKMLLAAFAEDTHTLTNQHLINAVKDSGFGDLPLHSPKQTGVRWWVAAMVVVSLVVVLRFIYLEGWLAGNDETAPIQESDESGSPRSEAKSRSEAAIDFQKSVNQALEVQPSSTGITTDSEALQIEQASTRAEVESAPTAVASQNTPVEPNRAQSPVEDSAPIKKEVASVEESSDKMTHSSKKTQQTKPKLDKVGENQSLEVVSSDQSEVGSRSWLERKMLKSKEWLRKADKQGVSIQVMMRNAAAADELAAYLRVHWPLSLENTYVYEVEIKNQRIYRVFYGEFPTVSRGNDMIEQLPESVRTNSPYLHSIYRMQQALL
jgi:type II secretory pathway predicted ATPase ExeA/septal ring-binding cell division protein DamX